MLQMPPGRIKKLFQEYIKSSNKNLMISKEALGILAEKSSEFMLNTIKIAAESVIAEERKVIQPGDISNTLNSRVNGPKLVPICNKEIQNSNITSEGSI